MRNKFLIFLTILTTLGCSQLNSDIKKTNDQDIELLNNKVKALSQDMPILERELKINELVDTGNLDVIDKLVSSEYTTAMNFYNINFLKLDKFQIWNFIANKKLTGDNLLKLIKNTTDEEVFYQLYNNYVKENTNPEVYFNSNLLRNKNFSILEKLSMNTKNNISVEEYLLKNSNSTILSNLALTSKNNEIIDKIFELTKNDFQIFENLISNSSISVDQCNNFLKFNKQKILSSSTSNLLDNINKNPACKKFLETCVSTNFSNSGPYINCIEGNIAVISTCISIKDSDTDQKTRIFIKESDKTWRKLEEISLIPNDPNCNKDFATGLSAAYSNSEFGLHELKTEIYNSKTMNFDETFWYVESKLKFKN